MPQSKQTLGRDPAIDLTKTLAIFGVLLIHSASVGYYLPLGSSTWYAAVLWGGLGRAAVPLFFLCSGAMMLSPEKDYPLKKLFGRNILHILLAMLVWAFLYQLLSLVGESGTITAAGLWQGVKDTLLLHHEFHLYYLHMILIVYLWLPVTRLVTRYASKQILEYILVLWFLFGILLPPAMNFWPFRLLDGIPLHYPINMTYAAIGYGVAGFYFRRYPPRRGISWLMTLGGLAIVLGGTVFGSLHRGELYTVFLEGMSPGVALYALGLFTLLHGRSYSPRCRSVAAVISKASFCIYLCHVFFLRGLARCGFTAATLPGWVSIPLLAASLFALSFLLYQLLRRIPWVRRWLI